MDITSKDIKRISDIAMMQSGIYMKSDPAGDIKYLQVKDINPGSKPDYSRITTVVDRGIGDQYRLRKNDLLFAAKGASNYCFLYDGVVEKMVASSAFIIIIQVIPQSVLSDLQIGIPSMQTQQLIVQMDQLRREGESIYSEINELKRSLQEQLLMDSLK